MKGFIELTIVEKGVESIGLIRVKSILYVHPDIGVHPDCRTIIHVGTPSALKIKEDYQAVKALIEVAL